MELWTEVRRRVLTGDLTKRAACAEYQLNWRTLEKILDHVEPPGYQRSKPRSRPTMEAFLPIIFEILEADRKAPPKQRHTAQRIFDRLVAEHDFGGCYSSVKEAVREWKQGNKEVFLPLTHRPGEAQVDFGFASIEVDGELQKAALFVMTLPYSDGLFVQAFPRECTESFQEGHRRAFEFFGAVPTRISYDNSRVAISKILGSRERRCTTGFLRLQSHYLFQSHFCLVRRANEKGHVENLVGFARRNFLVPVPRVSDFTELNDELLARCTSDLCRHVRGKSGMKRERLNEEHSTMLPLPSEVFLAKRMTQAAANSLSLVRFDCNSYSIPVKYAHREISIVASVDEVRLSFQGEVIAVHQRHWGREAFIFDPIHYLALLEKKPGGFDYARPLKDWNLPESMNVLRRRMEDGTGGLGTREFIRTLRLLESVTLGELVRAVDYALDIGIHDADSIRVILEHQQEDAVALFSLEGRPQLKTVHVEVTDAAAYQTLLMGENQ